MKRVSTADDGEMVNKERTTQQEMNLIAQIFDGTTS